MKRKISSRQAVYPENLSHGNENILGNNDTDCRIMLIVFLLAINDLHKNMSCNT